MQPPPYLLLGALRSLFRLYQFSELSAPDIILETERKILRDRLLELNCQQILELSQHWPDYQRSCIIQDEIEKAYSTPSFASHLNFLN